MDWLRDTRGPQYEKKAAPLLNDPWAARDAYIGVILDRTTESRERFLVAQAVPGLAAEQRVAIWRLMEMQRQAMLMYASDGWFFDDISGIETMQILGHAERAIQLAEDLSFSSPAAHFHEILAAARSNLADYGDGARIYDQSIRPLRVDLRRLAAYYSLSSLYQPPEQPIPLYSYAISGDPPRVRDTGAGRLVLGHGRLTSQITEESAALTYAALHRGGYHVWAGVIEDAHGATYQDLVRETLPPGEPKRPEEMAADLARLFGGPEYGLGALFHEMQHHLLDDIVDSGVRDLYAAYQHILEHHYLPQHYLAGSVCTIPPSFRPAAALVLGGRLRRELGRDELDRTVISALLDEVSACGMLLDYESLSYILGQTLARLADRFRVLPDDIEALVRVESAVWLSQLPNFSVNIWPAQRVVFEVSAHNYREQGDRADQGDKAALLWLKVFEALALRLGMAPLK
jgi:hypothetical protein